MKTEFISTPSPASRIPAVGELFRIATGSERLQGDSTVYVRVADECARPYFRGKEHREFGCCAMGVFYGLSLDEGVLRWGDPRIQTFEILKPVGVCEDGTVEFARKPSVEV